MRMTRWGNQLALPVSPQRDHIRGRQDAPVTLLEYGDYECPYCGLAYPIVEAVRKQMGDGLRFVFRHFPLVTMHPHAELAAEAAEAAGAQGKYWPMHDALYQNQQNLEPAALAVYAQSIELDMPRFARDLRGHVHAPKIAEDVLSGVRSGVQGTPSFFINGVRYEGSWDLPDLLAALRSAEAAMAAGEHA